MSIPNTRRPQKYISMMALEVGRSEQSIKNVFDDKLSVDGGTKKFWNFTLIPDFIVEKAVGLELFVKALLIYSAYREVKSC